MTFALRTYQVAAGEGLRAGLREGFRRQMLGSPTGSGKTECGMEIIRGAVSRGKRVTFLCNRIHLVGQTSRRLTAAGIGHGIVQSGNSVREYLPVIVASIQTVARRGLPETDLIIIDEAHAVAGSKEFRKIIIDRPGVPVIGMSATPWSKGLAKHFDELGGPLFERLVTATTIPDLIRDGWLVDADVYAPSEPDLSGVKIVAGDYNEEQLGAAVDKPELIGDIVAHWLKLANGAPTVCFATNIAHSKHIAAQFCLAGVTAEHIDCYTDDKTRDEVLARSKSGETSIITNVGILCEGWDFPACKVLILARPTRSRIRFIQMAGRVLRPYEGKDRALILDHSGTCKRLGFPTDHFALAMDDGKAKKPGDPKPKEEPLPKPCPACHFLKPAKVHKCPACGFAPERQSEVQVGDGELVLLTRSKGQEKAHRVRKGIEEFGSKQSTYGQLLTVQRSRGYKPGWSSNKFRTIWGVWPKGMTEDAEPVSGRMHQFLKAEAIRFSYAKQSRGAA